VMTIHRYLRQLGTFLAPRSVEAAESALRQFARWMVTQTQIRAIARIGRDDIEEYKVWLAAKRLSVGQVISAETHRQRMRTVHWSVAIAGAGDLGGGTFVLFGTICRVC